jgi:flagellar FliL protein
VSKLFANKKLLIIVLAAVLVLAGGGGGAMMMLKKKKPDAKAAGPKTTAGEIVDDAKGAAGGEGAAKEGEAKGGEGEAKEGAAPAKDASAKKSPFYALEKFTVNLLDPKGRWFVTTTIQIEMDSAKARAEIEEKVAPLRDATIMLLSSKTHEEVQSIGGKERLKRELQLRFEGILGAGAVKNIYLSDFMVVTR